VKKLIFSATCTTVLGLFSVLALILLYLALSDISDHESDLTLEWYIAGVSIIILSAFTISTFVTLGFLLKYLKISKANE
jgi:uncharacterized membrane protein